MLPRVFNLASATMIDMKKQNIARFGRSFRNGLLLLAVAASNPEASLFGQQPVTALHPEWRSLLDEKRSDWELWMGVPHQSVVGLPPGTPTSPDGHEGTPLGLNNDPKHVYSITNMDGEPVLHITGEVFGGLTTREAFSNYHLQLEVRWGQKKWEPKLAERRDSGLLFHCQGEHGVFWKVWKKCAEFQVEEGNMGDLFLLGGPAADVRQVAVSNSVFFSPVGKLEPAKTRICHLEGNFEKANGEWNVLELYTFGQKAVFVVNGHLVNVIENTRINGNAPLVSGQIQIQSEGAEVEYRRIRIQSITEIPKDLNAQSN